jgi:hypothetical protein
MPDRRILLSGLLLAAPVAATLPAPAAVEEWTFLKASAVGTAALVRFLDANWLAMDRIAVAQGLFAHARLYRAEPADAAAWDLAMIIGYKTPGGYDDVRTAFETIRAAHTPVQPDGQPLAALGRIIGSQRVQLAASA